MVHEEVNVPDSLVNVRRVYLYSSGESYILSSRAHIIHQFTSEDEALSWWSSFCTVRNLSYTVPKRTKPTPTSRTKPTPKGMRWGIGRDSGPSWWSPSWWNFSVSDSELSTLLGNEQPPNKGSKGVFSAAHRRLQEFVQENSTKIARLAELIHIPPAHISSILDIPTYSLMKAIKRLEELNQYQKDDELDIFSLHNEFESWKHKSSKSLMVKELDAAILCLERGEKFFVRSHQNSSSNSTDNKIQSNEQINNDMSDLRLAIKLELQADDLQQGLRNLELYCKDLQQFIHAKWCDITSPKRTFGLEPERNYDINVSVRLLSRLCIKQIRLRQAHHTPPAVGVDFVMDNGLVLQNTLDRNGQFILGDALKDVFSLYTHLLLHLAAVVHYFDLVTKNEYEPANNRPLVPQPGKSTLATKPSKSERTKRIRRSEPNKPSCPSDGATRLNPPDRTPRASWVDPFRRRLPPGRKPSFMKVLEADQYGINLQGPDYPQVQYTFVKPHSRGGDKDLPIYDYEQNYRAVKTFEALLDSIGL
jgi:hypothetical protein